MALAVLGEGGFRAGERDWKRLVAKERTGTAYWEEFPWCCEGNYSVSGGRYPVKSSRFCANNVGLAYPYSC